MTESQKGQHEEQTERSLTLEEARLGVGDLISLQTQSGDKVERHSVRLIGMAKGRSVLVSTPMVDGHYLLMREGQPMILRAFSGRSAYAFPTEILKNVNTPYPYLHLAYPREVRSLVVRHGARADVRLICAIEPCDATPVDTAGTIVNLSVGGALILLKKTPGKRDQKLKLKFKAVLNGIEALLEIDAVVRAINRDYSGETDTPFQMGVQFLDIPPEHSIPLLAFVYQALLEQVPGA